MTLPPNMTRVKHPPTQLKVSGRTSMKHTVRASRGRLAVFYLAVMVLPLLLSFLVHAAEVTATISGTVNDSTGAVVPKATVTLTNTGTNLSRAVVTDNSGS